MDGDEDARHRREEAERRAKRKAAKAGSRSDAQRAKRKEHAARVLARHQKGGPSPPSKRHKGDKGKPPPPPLPPGGTPSHFQNLFTQRAQGFQIDFRFRNAPPRPPVGPSFVGHSLDGVLVERSRQYKALNAVEVNYQWKLHSEPDLGVPLAPSAMDVKSYKAPAKHDQGEESKPKPKLHPDDEALLEWKGPLGDTAAENLKKRQDQMRAAARLALSEGKGRIPNILLPANVDRLTSPAAAAASVSSKKAFSRVLDEGMQTWMKKTTYLSNDYSRKVHDFKSLATTKQQLEKDLETKQQQMNMKRLAPAIKNTFTAATMPPTHPTKKNMKPKAIMSILPNVDHWGFSYTHVVIDKAPKIDMVKSDLAKAFVANVQQTDSKMTCQLWCPPPPKGDSDSEDEDDEKLEDEKDKDPPGTVRYHPIQEYDLDVVPLKDGDQPHVNFCLWVDPKNKVATYLPLSSRVQLSTGRPVKGRTLRRVSRRPKGEADMEEINDRSAEVDYDVAQKIGRPAPTKPAPVANSNSKDDGDDGEDFGDDSDDSDDDANKKTTPAAAANNDDDDDSDDEEETFGGLKTIVAEN
ncbi:expressed unknown protein [Seminavis robusta]|uniref:Uncharacterized protein n=1 Tax=Seminavis robusta TaxID=568900 RepID=A0A9N8ESU7_9STRA|nr:expressed unknown protein [Seminavis robusta]|eukprot:Sro1845_g301300.1 n/a (578) ;mRNA; r:15506-17320